MALIKDLEIGKNLALYVSEREIKFSLRFALVKQEEALNKLF